MVVLLNTSPVFPALYTVKSLIVLCNQWNFYLLYGKKPFHKCIGTTVLRKWYHDPEMILPMLGIKCIQPGKASLKPNSIYICCFFRFWEFLLQWKNLQNKAFFLAWRAFQFSSIPKQITDSTKINRPGHNIHMYWTNFRQPTAHLQQNIFGKTPIEVRSPHLYASFGTF